MPKKSNNAARMGSVLPKPPAGQRERLQWNPKEELVVFTHMVNNRRTRATNSGSVFEDWDSMQVDPLSAPVAASAPAIRDYVKQENRHTAIEAHDTLELLRLEPPSGQRAWPQCCTITSLSHTRGVMCLPAAADAERTVV